MNQKTLSLLKKPIVFIPVGLVGGLFGLVGLAFLSATYLPDTPTKPAIAKTETKCVTAGGVMWTGVKLYEKSDCAKSFATILGGNNDRNGQRMVKIRFDSGEVEWKTRNAVMDQAYVKMDDPAIKAGQWKELND